MVMYIHITAMIASPMDIYLYHYSLFLSPPKKKSLVALASGASYAGATKGFFWGGGGGGLGRVQKKGEKKKKEKKATLSRQAKETKKKKKKNDTREIVGGFLSSCLLFLYLHDSFLFLILGCFSDNPKATCSQGLRWPSVALYKRRYLLSYLRVFCSA